ncbi:MAG: putative toxin-antitoxin system toxin component, PIN family [Anaerolineales bacterium]|nr:putative toxin-antitoxin system toxin component, PIN family [Anaerolineales bacterium]
MRVVLDTNIIVSGYLGGYLEAIIVAWKSGEFTLVVSDTIVNEYLKVLKRPKFKIEKIEIDDFSALLIDKAEFVIPLEEITAISADETDNKFLEAAVAGKVNVIVSGDDHLLDLKNFRDIPILSAKEFLKQLNKI